MTDERGRKVFDLDSLDVGSGVSLFDGSGFVRIAASPESGEPSLVGQLPPAAARDLALNLLRASEAAESDSAIYAALTADGKAKPDEAVQAFLTDIRRRRDRFESGGEVPQEDDGRRRDGTT